VIPMSWSREVVGWVLIALGLWAFWVCYDEFLRNKKIFQAGPMAFIGFVLFRGGIHLLKVAVAARICQTGEAPKARPTVAINRPATKTTRRPVRQVPRQVVSQK